MRHLFTMAAALSLALSAPAHADTILRLGCETLYFDERGGKIMIIEQVVPSDMTPEEYEENYMYWKEDDIPAVMKWYDGSLSEIDSVDAKHAFLNELTATEPHSGMEAGELSYGARRVFFHPQDKPNWYFAVNMHLSPDKASYRQRGTGDGMKMFICEPVQFIPVEAE